MKIFLLFVGLALAQSDIQASLKPPVDASQQQSSLSESSAEASPPRALERIDQRLLEKKVAQMEAKESMKKLISELSYDHPKTARRLANMALKQQMRFLSQQQSLLGGLFKGKPLKQLARGAVLGMILIPRITQNIELKRLTKQFNEMKPAWQMSRNRKQAEVAKSEVMVGKLEESLQFLSDSTSQRITELGNFVDSTLRI